MAIWKLPVAAPLGVVLAILLHLWVAGSAAANEIVAGPACVPNSSPDGPAGVCFGIPPAPEGGIIGEISYRTSGPGQALVTVSGSGWCQNAYTEAEEVADFKTQIVYKVTDPVDHRGPGGLRFLNRLPKALPPPQGSQVVEPKIVPINFSSSRVFPVKRAKRERYFLKLRIIQFDDHVACYAYALNMTVLFVPD